VFASAAKAFAGVVAPRSINAISRHNPARMREWALLRAVKFPNIIGSAFPGLFFERQAFRLRFIQKAPLQTVLIPLSAFTVTGIAQDSHLHFPKTISSSRVVPDAPFMAKIQHAQS
jgi:hypothetical protein